MEHEEKKKTRRHASANQHRVWNAVITAVHGCGGRGDVSFSTVDIVLCSDARQAFFDPHANGCMVSRHRGLLHAACAAAARVY